MSLRSTLQAGNNRFLGGLAIGLCLMGVEFAAQAQSQEDIKSAFIYNFAKFTTWPATAFADASSPIKVTFVGSDVLAATFENVVKGKNANGREFAISKGAAGDAGSANIVVVDDPGQFAAVVASTKGKPVLTLGGEGFEVDAGNVKAASLSIEPKLLKIAKSIKGG
jgi:hypothetical protein